MDINCPKCNATISVEDSKTTVSCLNCGGLFVVGEENIDPTVNDIADKLGKLVDKAFKGNKNIKVKR